MPTPGTTLSIQAIPFEMRGKGVLREFWGIHGWFLILGRVESGAHDPATGVGRVGCTQRGVFASTDAKTIAAFDFVRSDVSRGASGLAAAELFRARIDGDAGGGVHVVVAAVGGAFLSAGLGDFVFFHSAIDCVGRGRGTQGEKEMTNDEALMTN